MPRELSEKVRKKMEQLKIDGFSAMGEFTDDELLEQLENIEELLEKRKAERPYTFPEEVNPGLVAQKQG